MRMPLLWILGFVCLSGVWAEEAVPPPPRLTPVPECTAGPERVDLSGTWRFSAAPPERFWEKADASGTGWADILVPGEWVMQGFTVARSATAGYVRSVDVPAEWKGRRVKLRFDGVYSEADVYVNGHKAGSHAGGFTPFELDVTDLVRPGSRATLALGVRSETLADELASGSQYAAHSLGGITRKAYLFAVPELNLASVHVETTFDADYRDATLSVVTTTVNEGHRPARGLALRVDVFDPAGNRLDLDLPLVPLRDIGAGSKLACSAGVPVPAPEKWDVEHPRLYTLSCTLVRGNRDVETVKKRFGFRQVEVRGDQLLVNNRPVKLRGSCRHETDPVRGRSLTPALWRKDAELFRAANVNYIRTSHYPPAEEFIEACDELGLFVEEEAPICWVGHVAGSPPFQEKAAEGEVQKLIVAQTLETIQRDRSHPSVIFWSLANESKWSPLFEASLKAADTIDPTRPKSFHDQAWGDFNNFGSAAPIAVYHYPTLAETDKKDAKNRPLLFGEYCHLNCYNRAEVVTDPGVRDFWGLYLAGMWERMYPARNCLGGALWAGIDEIFLLPSGQSTGYGPWGFIDGLRRPKPEYWHVKKVYSPVHIAEAALPVPDAGEPIAVRVANRHDFTNLGELRVDWQLSDRGKIIEWGTASGIDIAPRQEGAILVRTKAVELKGKKLGLVFTSPRGFVVDSYLLPLGEVAQAPDESPKAAGTLTETKDSISLAGKDMTWTVDKKSGSIRQVEADGRSLALGGPTLMVLPLKADPCAPNYAADSPPLNDTCKNGTVGAVVADGQTVVVRMRYDEAEGEYRLALDGAGRLKLSYRFVVSREMTPRQVGVVLDLPRDCDTLEWRRKAQWSVYPLDHIGRAEGKARAFPGGDAPAERPWAWDTNALGSADFRGSKENIEYASLVGPAGGGLGVRSDGHQTVRAFVDGERVRVLVAGFSNGGQNFQGSWEGGPRLALKAGSVVEDTVVLEVVR